MQPSQRSKAQIWSGGGRVVQVARARKPFMLLGFQSAGHSTAARRRESGLPLNAVSFHLHMTFILANSFGAGSLSPVGKNLRLLVDSDHAAL